MEKAKNNSFARSIDDEINKILGKEGKNIPQLYHYTTALGLIGLLQSNSIWATKAEFLNDPNEILYGIRLCKEIISNYNHENDSFVLALQVFLDIYLDDYLKEDSLFSDIFITSFCEQSEILGQWRQYGNKGNGYCIGFFIGDPMVIGPYHEDIVNSSYFYQYDLPLPIIYDDKEQRRIIETAIQIIKIKVKEELEEIGVKENSDKAFGYYQSVVRILIKKILPYIKKPEYNEEHEWRIVCNFKKEVNRIQFRNDGNNIIPYIRIGFYGNSSGEIMPSKLPIDEIVLGQSINFHKNKYSVAKLIESTNYSDVSIKRSSIEFLNDL